VTLVAGAPRSNPGREGRGDDDDVVVVDDTPTIAAGDAPAGNAPAGNAPATVAGDPVEARAMVAGDAREAMEAARRYLEKIQQPGGWWKGELETNVTMDAEDVLLRHFLGLLDARTLAGAARRIRALQRPDGAWPTFYGGPGELSATIEAYVALRLAGDSPAEPAMARAAEWARQAGGVENARVFTHVWLAMVGRWDWDKLPMVPPELVFLPASWPLSIWSFACWARQTIVALSIISAHRPRRPLPFDIPELSGGGPPRHRPIGALGTAFVVLDKLLRRYESVPAAFWPKRLVRSAALRAAERWIVARQEADGSWGGIQPPMVYSTIALVLQGYPLDHPVVAAALRGLEAFTIDDATGRRIEACQSPVWDTALAVIALLDAGAGADDEAVEAARRWLLQREVTAVGDWSVRRPHLAPGGWAFEFHNVNYPDIDDTAEVVMALRRSQVPEGDGAAGAGNDLSPVGGDVSPADDPPTAADDGAGACSRAVDWVVGMASGDGGWGAFDADNTSKLPNRLPFFDFGEVTDPPTADVTAHVVEMLASEPGPLSPAQREALELGVEWLSAHQEPDGSWWGRWGVNYVYGTGAVIPALVAAGAPAKDPRVADGVRWLIEHQNPDGGWGEDLRSYVEPGWKGRGASTPSQTAWALIGLLAAGERDHAATRAGVAWLVRSQDADGTWDEPWFTGTGFPWDFSLNYHLYRHVFPLSALGRYVLGTGPRPRGDAAARDAEA
jgi:squalene-hopene/tetraprenyl-beta-curcumene cyclase